MPASVAERTEQVGDTALVLFTYNRPAAFAHTLTSIFTSLEVLSRELPEYGGVPILISLDGPRPTPESRSLVDEVEQIARTRLPGAKIRREPVNRGLPSVLLATLNELFDAPGITRALCIEDDVELSPTALLALLTLSSSLRRGGAAERGHVIGAAPLHADGSVEHQALLVDAQAHRATRELLEEYIKKFSLDGAARDGAYGLRDHDAITRWSRTLAQGSGLPAPLGTSQDRMRELAWKRAGVLLTGTPVRLVKHRGLWGQHNTPWYALRTGQLFQRLNREPWERLKMRLERFTREGS